MVDSVDLYGKARRHAVDDDRQAWAVGFPGGQIAQHGGILQYYGFQFHSRDWKLIRDRRLRDQQKF
jgi:hypothetical protein